MNEVYLTIFSCHPALRTDYRKFANETEAVAYAKKLFDLSAANRDVNSNGDIWFYNARALPHIFLRDFTAQEISTANASDGVADCVKHGEIYRLEMPRQQAEAEKGISFVLENRAAAIASANRRKIAGNTINLGDLS